MNSDDDDMFAFCDEELPISSPKCNPVEEHLTKQLSTVQRRITKATNDIREVRDTTRRVLKSLYSQAQYGDDVTSDSDSDLYTIDGRPVLKKQKCNFSEWKHILTVQRIWKRVISNQWVIGVELQNTSTKILRNIEVYMSIKDEDEINGISTFWYLENTVFWRQTEIVQPQGEVVATVSFDLPKFTKNSFCDVYGTVSYEISEKEYQTPISLIRLEVEETIDSSYEITFSSELNNNILALKGTSVDKTVSIRVENTNTRKQLVKFLEGKSFEEISTDVYVVKTTGCLMYCLVEILSINDREVRLKIFSRCSEQMNVFTRLLVNKFPNIIPDEDVDLLNAAMALAEELKLYLTDASATELQIARIKTDLLIP